MEDDDGQTRFVVERHADTGTCLINGMTESASSPTDAVHGYAHQHAAPRRQVHEANVWCDPREQYTPPPRRATTGVWCPLEGAAGHADGSRTASQTRIEIGQHVRSDVRIPRPATAAGPVTVIITSTGVPTREVRRTRCRA